MRINVHIERLVLDGLPIDGRAAPLVQAAVEAELARLLGSGEFDTNFATAEVPFLRAAAIDLASPVNPALLGQHVAHSIAGGMTCDR